MDKFLVLVKIYRIIIIALLFLTISHVVFNSVDKSITFGISFIAFSVFYYFLIKTRSVKLFSWIFCIAIYLAIIAYSLQRSGIVAPGLHWMMIIVLLSSILLNKKAVIFWIVLITLSLIGIYLFEDELVFGVIGNQNWWHIVSISGLLIVGIYFVNIYQKETSRINNKLIELNNELKTQSTLLTQQAETISQQYDEIKKSHIELEDANDLLKEKKEKIGVVLKALYQISKEEDVHEGNLHEVRKLIVNYVKNFLKLDRVTFWVYDYSNEKLILDDNNIGSESESTLKEVSRSGHSEYFDFLINNEFLNVEDVKNNPLLINLKRNHISDYKFKSLLDCPIMSYGKLKGVICCESIEKRHWLDEEILLLKSLADAYVIAIKASQRKDANERLINKQLEIAELNSNLESMVYERTKKIQEMNRKLTRYAFINAHKIRGPLCRLLGLQVLMEMDNQLHPDEIKKHMLDGLNELDEVTKMASKILEDDEFSLRG
ncbi:GAF domain-containing protein [Mangrovivirga sp. M17]|uniref:GAF domain-containing protein n=1 Tax=Mangrovivirga halotolerans TaxID=2993936 RepID=A0ABT3RQ62_9BACT|nr:GAF domain-containing protein [Mangrovivirga halotolerans]MCX2743927.1 GAF domain-containing protein [Mangrovivirga halotolerans]